MVWIKQQWGILSAIILSVLMISGTYLLSNGILTTNKVDATNLSTVLKSVSSRDSDGDGLPDWEEVLYGTNPHKIDTFNLGMTDGEAVAKGLIVPKAPTPKNSSSSQITKTSTTTSNSVVKGFTPTQGSLTDVFIKNFFAQYLTMKKVSGGRPLSKQQMSGIVANAVQQVTSNKSTFTNFRNISQIKVSGSGQKALRAYAATVQKAFSRYTIPEDKGVLIYLNNAAKNNDVSALKHLQSLSKLYIDAASSLSQITATKETTVAHLELVNAYANMSTVINEMSKLDTDPVLVILAIPEYKKAVTSLAKAYIDLGSAFRKAGVVITPKDEGYSFVNLATIIANKQSKNKTQ